MLTTSHGGWRGRHSGCVVFATNVKRLQFEVTDPLGATVTSTLSESDITGKAIIEAANVCGLTQIPEAERDPTYGLGEWIIEVLDQGYRQLLIGLGGSAINEGGLGLLQALDVRFYDANGQEAGYFGQDL